MNTDSGKEEGEGTSPGRLCLDVLTIGDITGVGGDGVPCLCGYVYLRSYIPVFHVDPPLLDDRGLQGR